MPKAREKIIAKGFEEIILFDKLRNELIEPGYIESVEFVKDIDLEKVIDMRGYLIDEVIKSQSVSVNSILLQSTKSEMDIMLKERYAYLKAWGKMTDDEVQVLVIPECKINSSLKRKWSNEVSKLELKVDALKILNYNDYFYLRTIHPLDIPPLFHKVVQWFDFRSDLQVINYITPSPAQDIINELVNLGYKSKIVNVIKEDDAMIFNDDAGLKLYDNLPAGYSIINFNDALGTNDYILASGWFYAADHFPFSFFPPDPNYRGMHRFVLIHKSGLGYEIETYNLSAGEWISTINNDIELYMHNEAGPEFWLSHLYVYENLTSDEYDILKNWIIRRG